MARTKVTEADGLTASSVMHAQFSALSATSTVGEVREWFAASASRRLAFIADEGRYAGSLTPELLQGVLDPLQPAAEVADQGPTVAPDAPATVGRDLALLTDARRVPVVDDAGQLLGVVAVTSDLQCFCGTG